MAENAAESPTPILPDTAYADLGLPKEVKPRSKRRKVILAVTAVALVAALGGASWYTGWPQPVWQAVRAAEVIVKVREGGTFSVAGASLEVDNRTFVTDENGRAVIDLQRGEYTGRVFKEGYVEKPFTLSLRRGDNELVYLDIEAVPVPLFAIEGTVTDAITDQPLAGAEVAVGELKQITGETGGFSFPGYAAGSYEVAIRLEGFRSITETVEITAEGLAEKPAAALVPEGHVVFTSNRDGKRALYVSGYDGSDQRRLFEQDAGGEDYANIIAPTGDKMVFSSTRDQVKSTRGDALAKLYLADVSGQNLRKISDDVTLAFNGVTWSPDGQKVFFSGYTGPRLDQATFRVYDIGRSMLLDFGEAAYDVTFSADSSLVAYRTNVSEEIAGEEGDEPVIRHYSVLKTLNIVSGERREAARREGQVEAIRFEAEGRISYETTVDGVRRRFSVAQQGGAEQETPVDPRASRAYSLSPDGQFSAFTEERDGKRDLFVLDVKDEEQRLTDVGRLFFGFKPVWLGDRYLLFAVHREGETALYVVGAHGGGEMKKVADYHEENK